MIINERQEKDALVLSIKGRLDADTAAAFTSKISALISSGSMHFVVDLGNLHFLNSSGLSALVSTLRLAIDAGGDMKIANLKPEMKSLFAMTRLNTIFEIHETTQKALDAFKQAPASSRKVSATPA